LPGGRNLSLKGVYQLSFARGGCRGSTSIPISIMTVVSIAVVSVLVGGRDVAQDSCQHNRDYDTCQQQSAA